MSSQTQAVILTNLQAAGHADGHAYEVILSLKRAAKEMPGNGRHYPALHNNSLDAGAYTL